jgi:hypothetical protein
MDERENISYQHIFPLVIKPLKSLSSSSFCYEIVLDEVYILVPAPALILRSPKLASINNSFSLAICLFIPFSLLFSLVLLIAS